MDSYWFVLLITSMAVHLTGTGGSSAPSSTSPTLFISLPSANFIQGTVLTTVQSRVQNPNFKVEHNKDCPEDLFDVGRLGELSLLRTLDFSDDPLKPLCRTNGQDDYLISIQTFYCTVIESNSNGIPVVINVIPVLVSTQLTFPVAFYTGTVVEGVENTTVIMSTDTTPVVAQTQPVNELLTPDYRIIGEYANDFMVISQRDRCQMYPRIISTRALNRTEQSMFEITLEAFSDAHSATTTISIEVLDINNQRPRFVNPQTSLTLSEDTLLGSEPVQFSAIDGDSNQLNSDIRFSVATTNSPFTIHPLTGHLSLYTPLEENFEISILASDLGNPSLTMYTNLTIFTSDANDFPPEITVENLGLLNVSENAPIGTEVTTFIVTDTDSTETTVTILNVGQANYFSVEEDTPGRYRLLLIAALDFERSLNGMYSVILTAVDNGGLSVETRVDIAVIDENELPFFPQSMYEAEVSEGVPIRSVVFQLSALDPDTSVFSELTYSISSTSPLAPLFDVHSESGSIFTTSDIDYEALSTKTLVFDVSASDRNQPELSSTAMLTVYIRDENDNIPTFATPKVNISLLESHDADRSVHLFTVTDQDSGCNGAVQYSIIHSEPLDIFQIDSYSGYLYLASDSVLNFNEFQSAAVVVQATDLGDRWSHSSECTLYISIIPANTEAPILDPISCPCFIRENILTRQVCFQLSAHDSDSSNLQYSIISGNERGVFSIDSTTGIVQSTGALDREIQAEYSLEIIVSDGIFNSEPQILNIRIVDDDDSAPIFSSSTINIAAPTDLVVGDFIGSVAATDLDAGFNALIDHQFQQGVESRVTNAIKLDPLSGKLFVKQTLSSDQEYTFVVVASSLAQPSQQSSASVTVTLSGTKNNPPYFELSTEHFLVASDLAVDVRIANVSAKDDDNGVNGNLLYNLEQDTGNHSDLFRVSAAGVITSTQSLSALAGEVYSLNISATDGGSPSIIAYQEVIITVYESEITIGQTLLVYNPSVPPCHYYGFVQELIDSAFSIIFFSTAQGSQTATVTLLDSEFSSAFNLNQIPSNQQADLKTVGGFGNTAFQGREAIYLQIRATYGSNFHLCSVTVRIEDINNNAPQFDQEAYSFEIYQNTPMGSSVFQILVSDEDVGSNAQPQFYRIDAGSATNPFVIDASTGEIEVLGSLEEPFYTFPVEAVDDTSFPVDNVKTATTTVEVTVVERTNRVPSLSVSENNISVPETHFGQITTVTLSDFVDRGSFATNRFCIASGNVQDVFLVTSGGDINVKTGLDFESQPATFNLVIVAYDTTPNPAWQETRVTINLIDQNDVTPVFTAPIYVATIAENVPNSTPVILVHATDKDTGVNGEVQYSLTEPAGAFSIDIQSGLITTSGPLDRETFPSYSLTVVATDQGPLPLSSRCTVIVTILDVNDNSPSFLTLDVPVMFSEDRSIGSEIFKLEAEDDDIGANGAMKYSILSGNDNFVFRLNPWTGAVMLAKEVDYEAGSLSFVVTFQVQDLGTPGALTGSSLTLTFTVQDVNDNYPVFSSQVYQCSIMEGNSGAFNPACEVNAMDADATGNMVQYSLLDTDVPFTISNGVISRNGPIDRETNSQYVLRVQAQDSGSPLKSSVALVHITVQDINDHVPTFESINTFHIPELLPLNTLLFFFHATDFDSDSDFSQISYSLSSDNEDFQLDATTGAIFLNRLLDFESQETYSFEVVATNPSGTQTPTTYTLNVIDINENLLPPVFEEGNNPTVVSVAKDTAVNTVIGNLTAEDPDAPLGVPSISYHAIGGSAYGYFKINAITGVLSTAFPLRSLDATVLTLIVIASDGGPHPLSTTMVLNIELTPAADIAPYFVDSVFTVDLNQTIDINHIITVVRAEVDGYYDPFVCYSISSGNDNGYFAINNSTGAISSTVGPGAFEEGLTFSLIVTASKPSVSGTSSALVLINFRNTNTFTPEFREDGYDLSLVETYPVGPSTSFVRVFARDFNLGENGRLTYTLQNEDALPFGISSTTGDMYLTSSLDGTATRNYTVTVMVQDNGDPASSSFASLTITVIPAATQSAASPAFSLQLGLEVSEDSMVNFNSLRTLTPTNTVTHTLMYRIRDQPVEFTISPNTGEIYLTAPLDFETTPEYTLIIEVSDGVNTYDGIATIRVTVIDVNDNRPQFTSPMFTGSVEEHTSDGSIVSTLTATDMDSQSPETLTYSLVDSLPPESLSLFRLNPSGTLTVNGDLDREEIPVHILTVAVEDNGGLLNYARVMVTVLDINDHIPAFLFPLVEISVREDAANESVILILGTFDPDIDSNAQNVYDLEPGNVPFDILATTGELIVTGTLDAEIQAQYNIVVTVQNINHGDMNQKNLTVNVIDVLDSFPVLPVINIAAVQENLPAYSQVASFYESANSRPVFYSIISGNELGRFFIEPFTGILRTSLPLDREQQSEYELTIQGSFGRGRETDLLVRVTITDENDNAPHFPSVFLQLDIPESTPLGVPMFSLNVSDADAGTNAQFSSFLIEDNIAAEYFTVDTDGNLQLSQPLNRDAFGSITFDLYCFDNGVPVQYSQAQIQVNVIDSNNNQPQFEQSSYVFTVSTPALIAIPQFSVQATDRDFGVSGEVQYSFGGGNGTSKFAINSATGEISVRDNYGLQSSYQLIVIATDGGGLSSIPATIEVLIKECGFQQLQFRPDFVSLEIMENLPVNSIIVRPEIFNLLEFGQTSTYQYSLTISVFDVDEDSGQVFVNEGLDREEKEFYQLVLQARDRSDTERIAQAEIEIRLLDENDNAPMFVPPPTPESPYIAFLRNNETVGYQVFRVQATDSDQGVNAEITYSIFEDSSNIFIIDEVSGQISLSSSISDLSLSSVVTIVVQAIDGGNTPLNTTVSIDIHIVDSNAPRFSMESYRTNISENAAIGATVTTVLALSVTPDITYRLDDDTLPFVIGRRDGVVKVRDPGLDYEFRSFYSLTLIAEDSSTSSLLLGRARLDIEVLDVNDNTPVFDNPSSFYTAQVSENITVPSTIALVLAADRDSQPNAGITYIIEGNMFTTKFNVNPTSGSISVIDELDYEELPLYEFNILALDSGFPQLTGTATVRVGLTNINDNPPVFTQTSYTVSVSEMALPGTNLFLFVSAMDPDNLDPLVYSIIPDVPGHENFDITSDGLLVLNQQSVSLTEVSYELNISASDGTFFGYTTVVVEVQDINDNSPVFNQTMYTASIIENLENQFVTQVFATDADQGTNAEITYSITTTVFQIDQQSGVIMATAAIDRESNPSFVFTVVGRDGGGRTGRVDVMVIVQDVNDNAPMFIQTTYEGTAVEGSAPGTPVVTITALDRDIDDNGRVIYTLDGIDNIMQFPFTLDMTTGVISVGGFSPDPDVQDEYTFRVSARDSGSFSLTADTQANVTILVVPRTDRALEFTSPEYVRIPEDADRGSLVVELTVSNTSCMPGTEPFYFITFQDGDSFTINQGENQVLVDREPLTVGNYTLQLRALCFVGGDTLRETQILTIEVVDLNSPPTFILDSSGGSVLAYRSNVPEDAPQNSELSMNALNNMGQLVAVSAIQAQDLDEGINGTFTFRLTDSAGQNDNAAFYINPTSGVMSVIEELDFDFGPQSYSFCVEVVDGGNPPLSASVSVTITVEDANDIPPMFPTDLYTIEVPEDIEPNIVFFRIEAVDNDTKPENKMITYQLSSGQFAVDMSTGDISTVVSLDRETRFTYNLTALAYDGVFADDVQIRIVVTDVNDQPPVFNQTLYSITLTENYPTGVPFLQVFTTDADEGENAQTSFSIIEQPDNIAVIDNTTGEISFLVLPDYEFFPRLDLQVRASDVENPNLFQIVTVAITLEDVNDNSPVFTEQSYSPRVYENRPSGTSVFRVEAIDEDSGANGIVSYTLAGDGKEFFNITNGVITTKLPIDREMNSTFEIIVTATDSGVPRQNSSVTVLVTVLDENDQRPVFDMEGYRVAVSEFESGGFSFLTVRAEDRDEGLNARITYRLLGENNNDFITQSNPDGSATLSLLKPLNYERINEYNISLRAIDGGFPSMETTVTLVVEVIDENDNPPVFEEFSYEGSIREDASAGSLILSVSAADLDVSDVLVYTIQNGLTYPELSINSSTGDIYVGSSLDHESIEQHSLVVIAADQTDAPMSATAEVTITVIDVNDNPPHFLPHNSTQYVTENDAPDIEVFTLETSDLDSVSIPGRREYTIDSGNINNVFEIDSVSGVVTVRQTLDREAISSYFLTISATDNGVPSLTGSTNITVIVEDVNDNSPTGGHQDIYLYLLNGKAPMVTLGQVFVNDSDIINEHTYTVIDNPSNSLLVLDDGTIELNSETPASSDITVVIKDGSNGQAETTISSVIRNITAESLVNSFSMQFARISPQSFVDNVLGSFLGLAASALIDSLRDYSSVEEIDLQVFGIQESRDSSGNLDVFILVADIINGGFVHPNLVQHALHINRRALEEALKVDIVTEFVDLCSSESCSSGLICSNNFEYSSTGSISFGSRSIAYLGLATEHTASCQPVQPSACETLVGCNEPAYCIESESTATCQDSCSPDPCKNGGSCQPQFPGYYCVCPTGYEGRNCELTGATFTGSSYAIFPSIARQQSGTISLEVITNENHGLLFYIGRFDSLYNDFMALEIEGGKPSVIVSYGDRDSKRTQRFEDTRTLSNLVWHQLTIDYTQTSVTLSWTTYDPFTVETSVASITGDFRFLDIGSPLIFGSLPFNYGEISFQPFTGCVRNVRINGKLIDFSETLEDDNLERGCLNTDRQCGNSPCANGGSCVGVWGSFYCDCTTSYAGIQCDQDSETATFSGENFIRYEIKKTIAVRPLRQTSTPYTTAQNEIRLSLATAQSSGTVLQLGDPVNSQEYLLLEIVNGRLQLRYNLGSGETILQQNSVQINDQQFHDVTITRTERDIEIVIDGKYVNRAVSPPPEATLDIPVDRMYLGAGLNPVNGTAINGFIGCVLGFRLDRKEVPIGGENGGFITLEILDTVTNGCPYGSLSETPQPDEYVYTAIAVILVVLLLISASFVAVCMIARWTRNRRTGRHRVNLSRNSTRRSWNFRSGGTNSPTQDGFQWQSASTYKHDMTSPPGVYRSTPQHESDPTLNFNMSTRNSVNSSNPASGIPITDVAETSFNLPNQRASARGQQRLKIPQPKEGFSFSQPNQGYRDDIDLGTTQPKHLRSFSGQQSILSASTIATSSLHDDTEVNTFLGKQLAVANSEILELNVDEMKHYKEEGPYQPLGSVGSLLDFVKELDPEHRYREKKKEQHQFPGASPAISLEEETLVNSGRRAKVQSRPPQGSSSNRTVKTSPLTGQKFDVGNEEHVKEHPLPRAVKMRDNSQAQRHTRSSQRNSHSKKMENILERFHNITTGHYPDEGRLI